MKYLLLLIPLLFIAACTQNNSSSVTIPQTPIADNGSPIVAPVEIVVPNISENNTSNVTANITNVEITQSTIYDIEADDYAFYPNTLTVHKGDRIQLLITVDTQRVYSSGLEFRSPQFNESYPVKAGDNVTINLTINGYTEIQSFAMGTSNFKTGMRILVNDT